MHAGERQQQGSQSPAARLLAAHKLVQSAQPSGIHCRRRHQQAAGQASLWQAPSRVIRRSCPHLRDILLASLLTVLSASSSSWLLMGLATARLSTRRSWCCSHCIGATCGRGWVGVRVRVQCVSGAQPVRKERGLAARGAMPRPVPALSAGRSSGVHAVGCMQCLGREHECTGCHACMHRAVHVSQVEQAHSSFGMPPGVPAAETLHHVCHHLTTSAEQKSTGQQPSSPAP
jgi:hypothetical protein